MSIIYRPVSNYIKPDYGRQSPGEIKKMASEILVSLEAVKYEEANERTKEMYDAAKAQAGIVPNMYANMANVPAVLDLYTQNYQMFREQGGFTPQEQEVIFLAINYENHCEYRMGAHSMIADKMSGVATDVLQAIRQGKEIPDTKLAALDKFT